MAACRQHFFGLRVIFGLAGVFRLNVAFVMPAPPLSDSQLLDRLRTRDEAAYAVLYRFYYPAVERFVGRNNGTAADAADVFQETLLVLLDRVPTEDFTLTSSLKTYVLAVAQNVWLKRLRDSRRLLRQALPIESADADGSPCAAAAGPAGNGRTRPRRRRRASLMGWCRRLCAA